MRQPNKTSIDIVATVKSDTVELHGVSCRIKYPVAPYGKVKLTLYCDRSTKDKLTTTLPQWFRVEGKEQGNFSPAVIVIAEGIVFQNWKAKRSGLAGTARPGKLTVINDFRHSGPKGPTEVTLYLNDRSVPSLLSNKSIGLGADVELKAAYTPEPDKHPILQARLPPHYDPEAWIAKPHVRELLALVSFASRRRVSCVGWEYSNVAQTVSCYPYHPFLEAEDRHSSDQELLIQPPSDVCEFLKVALAKLISRKDYVLGSIFYVVPLLHEERTIEGDYILLFAALEMLLMSYRKDNNAESIFPTRDWRRLRKEIQKILPVLFPNQEGEAKCRTLQQNLPGLNRVPLANAFEAFCATYKLNETDREKFQEFKKIRNKIVHGMICDIDDKVLTAVVELKYLVEKMILVLLGWDISRSSLTEEYTRQARSPWYKLS